METGYLKRQRSCVVMRKQYWGASRKEVECTTDGFSGAEIEGGGVEGWGVRSRGWTATGPAVFEEHLAGAELGKVKGAGPMRS